MHLACAGVLALVALAFGAPSAVPTTQMKAPLEPVAATTARPAKDQVVVPPELYEQQLKALSHDKKAPSRSRRGAGHANPYMLYTCKLGLEFSSWMHVQVFKSFLILLHFRAYMRRPACYLHDVGVG